MRIMRQEHARMERATVACCLLKVVPLIADAAHYVHTITSGPIELCKGIVDGYFLHDIGNFWLIQVAHKFM